MSDLIDYEGSGVYSITNIVNGKVYVGSSLSVRGRQISHLSCLRRGIHRNRYLQRAYDKWGECRFRFDLLERCEPSQVLVKEQYWIDKLQSADPSQGYNLALFAEAAGKGRVPTEEQRRKQSEALKGRCPVGQKAAVEANRGSKRSIETRKKMSRAKLNRSKAEIDLAKARRRFRIKFGPRWREILGIPKSK